MTSDKIKRTESSQNSLEDSISIARDYLKDGKHIDDIDLLNSLGNQFSMEVMQKLPKTIPTDFTDSLTIGFLKKNGILPVLSKEHPFIAINNPLNFQAIDDIRRILKLPNVTAVICPYLTILTAVNNIFDMAQGSAEDVIQDIDDEDPERLFSEIEEVGDLLDDTSASPVIRLVNLMFSQAVRDGASDIHIEPYQHSVNIRQRLDGILHDMLTPPKHVQASLISRIKIMAKLDIAEKRLPQDGRLELKIGNKEMDVRISTLPTAFGERVVMRLLDKSSVIIPLTDIGISPDRLTRFKKEVEGSNGIILVTGPTGSGKTTTLYAALSLIKNSDINILTIEDPIEYRIDGIGQVQVNPKIDLTFASGLRSIVRQDPDVLLIGEIRDKETADIAIQSALTGHLVFSTLHTNDAASAITRLRDMGLEPFLLSSSINAVLAQRLVRVICTECKEVYTPKEEELLKIGLSQKDALDKKFYSGTGCSHCRFTGYRSRTGIFELLTMTKEMKKLILTTADSDTLRQHATSQDNMLTLQDDGINKIFKGITTIEEVYRVCHT